MNTYAPKTALALVASLFVAGFASSAIASKPQALLIAPDHDYHLPKFGFGSFNIHGVGERVTNVRWNGLASRMGLEPGDLILSMNGFPLKYHGSWNDALHQAIHNGGLVRLRIRDVRTGHIAFREVYVGDGYGPVTPKSHVAGYGPTTSHLIVDTQPHNPHFGHGHPVGPITQKSKVGSQLNKKFNKQPAGPKNLNKSIKQLVKLFDDKD